MLVAAAVVHMDSTHPSSAGSTISPPPWHPAVPVASTHHQQHQPALFDPDLIPAPPSPPPASRSPRNHIRPPGASRRPSSRRRPRPSRKVPTTYISADPASFRHMVHQVTGAVDLAPQQQHGATLLCRPAPSRAAAAAAGALPTLDTSALLLLGRDGSGSGSARRTTGPAASVRPAAAVAAASEVDLGACGGVGVGHGVGGAGYGGSDCGGGGGFPTLESWDALLY